ncbi:MAG: YbaK/EbsC family protein, partial [Hyphomicrobiaceae bacterium]
LLVSGANRVNEKATSRRIGEPLERPDAVYVRDVTGYAIGGIPPLGHTEPIATFMDETLLEFVNVWAAAGTPNAVFSVVPDQLVEVTGAKIICVT